MMKRPRILLTRHWPGAVTAHLRERYDLTIPTPDRPMSADDLCAAMRQFDAVCPTVTDRIDAATLATPCATVRILANYGAGIDHIDVEAARRCGIIVTNTPDVLSEATAELSVLLMLMASRRAGEGERQLRAGGWPGWSPTHMLGQALGGRLLGLVGFGRIAQATARIARAAFGMRIAYHSRRRLETIPTDLGPDIGYHQSLESLLAEADVVSLHCPGGEVTHHLIDGRRLKLMKRSAILINTARGTVVDAAALAAALRDGTIAAAALDVYEGEPAVPPELVALENVVLLPHLGSATLETRVGMGMRAAANLDQFFAGREPHDRVA